jgi:4-amino-4-deoxy-L-arabinose transferase-like glycosyltransferase
VIKISRREGSPIAAAPKGMVRGRGFVGPGGVALLILATLALRLAWGWALGLGIDESYMVAAGRHPQLSYFDHPPLAWQLAWGAARLFGGEAAIVVRLPFILLFALTTWLMYRLTERAFGAAAGFAAAIVLNLAPELSVTAGSWVLPDGPLLAALLGAALCLQRAVPEDRRAAWGWWLGAGACAGLALLAKYSAVLTIAGALIFLLTEPAARRWLLRPQPYAAGILALILFSPVIVWNAEHGWVSFLFQGERAGGHFFPFGPLLALAGAALFLLPWIWVGLLICGVTALRRGPADRERWFFFCLAAPPIVVFTFVAWWSRVLYHWSAPGYLMLLPLLGEAVARRRQRGWLIATAALLLAGLVLTASEVRLAWLPGLADGRLLGRDPAVDAIDWTSLRDAFARRGYLDRKGLVVGAIRWLDAGKIDYALGGAMPVVCLGPDPRQYGLIAPLRDYAGGDVLIAAPRSSLEMIRAQFGPLFEAIEPLPPARVLHAGRPALDVPLYLGRRLKLTGGPADSP